MSKKKSSVFQEKINRGDTAELTDRQTVMTKKVVSFSAKIGVTPLVAAPGDTNRSDATDLPVFKKKNLKNKIICNIHDTTIPCRCRTCQ